MYQTTLRAYVMHRDHGRCQYCGRRPKGSDKLTLDHIVPRADNGANTPDNLVAACMPCNLKKGKQHAADFLRRKPTVLARIREQLRQPLDWRGAHLTPSFRHCSGNCGSGTGP